MKIINNISLKDDSFIEAFLIDLTCRCMKIAMLDYEKKIFYKKDGTVITKTDSKINDLIIKELNKFFPKIPIISEEKSFKKTTFLEKKYWIIDPIDGTSSFARGADNYTINLALIEDGIPKLGVIGNPPTDTIWYGNSRNGFVKRKGSNVNLEVSKFNDKNIRLLLSTNADKDTMNLVKNINNKSIERYSSSIKFCRIAEGKADVYPRLQSINKWDIAAGDAILRSAGGSLLNTDGTNYKYNFKSEKTGPFIATSSIKFLRYFK